MKLDWETLSRDTKGVTERKQRALRKSVDVRVGLRRRGTQTAKANLSDISCTGFNIETGDFYTVDDLIWLHLPNMQPMGAIVKRVSNHGAGCEFQTPIRDYIFDDLVRRLNA